VFTYSVSTYVELREQVASAVQFLPDKPEETADSTLRALWFFAAGTAKSAELSASGELPTLTAQQLNYLQALISKRIDGIPLPHITGRQQFMELEMLAGPDALVPRKETEILGRVAVAQARLLSQQVAAPLVVDVCTGSGNIALAVARYVDTARVFAADLSKEAVELARRNAAHLLLGDRVEFRDGDLLAPFDNDDFLGKVDLLTCNPPYINSAKVQTMAKEIAEHEPRLAFDGGALGIGILMRLTQQAPRYLRSGGVLAFEMGLGQGAALVKRLNGSGAFKDVQTAVDEAGAIRVVYARC
jgi:release factor glutamine methyltransferase